MQIWRSQNLVVYLHKEKEGYAALLFLCLPPENFLKHRKFFL